jgi:gamma-glutamyltranspeptidase / glutathione hydrolase
MMAITLTHGGSYGARVSVNELGMVLGHGMSRFDPRPGRPNSVGPGKRPITNMCPTIVTRKGTPVFAVGAAGGTRIPNSVYEVLLNYVGLDAQLETAMSSPRLDANGSLKIGLEKTHPAADEAFFQKLGYTTSRVPSAYVSAVERDSKTAKARGLSSGGA